jgi:hypothetical protein
VSAGDHQSAQALSREAIKIFKTKLMPESQLENSKSIDMAYFSKVKDNLVDLNNLLNDKASPEDLMNIVHMQIHPGLQLAYGLELKEMR